MTGCQDSSAFDHAAVREMVKKHFKGDPEKLAEPLIDHIHTLVNRHIEACRGIEVAPEIDRTVIEAAEDYRLMQTTGVSVLDRAPEGSELPVQRLLQYVSPRRSER